MTDFWNSVALTGETRRDSAYLPRIVQHVPHEMVFNLCAYDCLYLRNLSARCGWDDHLRVESAGLAIQKQTRPCP